ncbi:KTSC domain-containing protein [Caulobacter sp. SLTY]|uniref:KTSC domain-containing protein n=1 Tax=Caulobacter sp. SLTY TaxID=2683262 RepID=UPI001411C3E4|nr:KTSC domain-containing protein [Caulobacter sp. SLTY]NBB13922.1 KTSC domain-containing protein [Caulobacter sp. SLTY]
MPSDAAPSTAIAKIRYKPTHGKLFVRFREGGEYVYVGVPGEVHRSFVEAESKGQFFQAEIRDRYPYNRVDDAP